jgi:hypothetical protein
MDPRTTLSGSAADTAGAADTPRRARHSRRPSPSSLRRPGLFLAVAAAGAVLVNVLTGTGPAAQAEAGASEPVSVAEQLGLTASSVEVDDPQDLRPLEQLAATRNSREDAQNAAAQVQVAADQAEVERRAAEEAAARAAAEKAAAEAAAAKAAEEAAAAEAKAAAEAEAAAEAAEEAAPQTTTSTARAASAPVSGTLANLVAKISNTAGAVKSQVQAAADQVISNVPGAGSITLGGTRPSATDPNGHPSGLALDYMVLTNSGLGDAIAQYHIDHWDELGVEYVIWEQRILSSPGGAWKAMADRGGVTANHFDHVHVNYR